MLKNESPMSRFEECGKATSLYDLLALIIGGKDSLTKADIDPTSIRRQVIK